MLAEIQTGIQPVVYQMFSLVQNNSGDSASYGRENSQILETAEQLEQEVRQYKLQTENLKKQMAEDRREFEKEMEQLQAENKKYLDTLIKHSKGEKVKLPGGARPQTAKPTTSPGYQSNKGFTSQASQKPMKGGNLGKKLVVKSGNINGQIGQTHIRNLSLKQITDIITDIYQQKIKYDQKCEENKLPRETMEQYMYTYLNQRYGLKNLIIEWAASIINAIKKYSKLDHTVGLFGKILRNECDEEFRFIQVHIRDTLD